MQFEKYKYNEFETAFIMAYVSFCVLCVCY